jgi:hypothetical protein
MIPGRIFSASPHTLLEGMVLWSPSIRAGLKPSQLLPQQAPSRPLSVGYMNCAKHQELPGKKPLSEKKLVSLSLEPATGRQQGVLFTLSLGVLIMLLRGTWSFLKGGLCVSDSADTNRGLGRNLAP